MGFVSYQEDIEKIRQDYLHFWRSTTSVIDKLTKTKQAIFDEQEYREGLRKLGELKQIKVAASELADDLVIRLRDQLVVAESLRDSAINYLSTTGVHAADRMKKLTAQRDGLRVSNEEIAAQLTRARKRTADLTEANQALLAEVNALRRELTDTKSQNAMLEAFRGVTPLKR